MLQTEPGQRGIPFEAAFSATFDLALSSPYNMAWYMIEPRFYDLYRHSWPIDDMEFWQLTGIDTDRGRHVVPTDDASQDEAGMYEYRYWTYSQPDATRSIRLVRSYSLNQEIGYRSHRSPEGIVETAFPLDVCERFRPLARTIPQLALVANRLVAWSADITEDVRQHIDPRSLNRTVSGLVTHDLTLAGAYVAAPNLAVAEFSALDLDSGPTHRTISDILSKTLGKVLLDSQVGTLTAAGSARLNKQRTSEVVKYLDQFSALPDYFWINFGIKAGIAVKVPHFLQVLHDKLEGPGGIRILEHISEHEAQNLAGYFITRILENFQVDQNRHRVNAAQFLKLTRINESPNANVNLRKIIAISNMLPDRPPDTRDFNPNIDPSIPLNHIDRRFLGAAVQRILTYTMRDGVEQAEENRQMAQDQMLTSIVELIAFRGKPKK